MQSISSTVIFTLQFYVIAVKSDTLIETGTFFAKQIALLSDKLHYFL